MSIQFYFTPSLGTFYILVLVACIASAVQYRMISSRRSDGTVFTCGQLVGQLLMSLVSAYFVASALVGRLLGFHTLPQGFHVDVFKDPFAVFRGALDFMNIFHPQTVLVDEGLGLISWLFTLDAYILLVCSIMILVFFIWVTPLTAFYLVSSVWFVLRSFVQHFAEKSCGCHRNRLQPSHDLEPQVQ
ncbi:hypothetical protein ACTXJX_11750 [Glutamicibacter ardleyensis]|uniref:hypothetical protein n=1 Tax=Glutamicibacter ardleyensis TaxID=225894 RepID=UPI003FD456F2